MKHKYQHALEIVAAALRSAKPVKFSSLKINDLHYSENWRTLKTLEVEGVIEILTVRGELYFRPTERTEFLFTFVKNAK